MVRSWLLVTLVTQCTYLVNTLVVSNGRGCLPGQYPGPGSPPCSKSYHGSGNLFATPAPGKYAMPTPNPAGSLFPGCSCKMPLDRPPMPAAAPPGGPPAFEVTEIRPGEVEVLTVDVRLANRVRCENASIAADVAKLLKIPVERIKVEPWSWQLPDPPQHNYLAFVQQDHERCDCQANGDLEGYRHVDAATEGYQVGSDTQVMTVSQFNAWSGKGSANALMCEDGFPLLPVAANMCPPSGGFLPRCDTVSSGEICDGNGECGTSASLNNCGERDVYKKACGSMAPPQPVANPGMPAPPQCTCDEEGMPILMAGQLACADLLVLTPIHPSECPAHGHVPKCDDVAGGEICDGDGECGTSTELDNCGDWDLYRKAEKPCPCAKDSREGTLIRASGCGSEWNTPVRFLNHQPANEGAAHAGDLSTSLTLEGVPGFMRGGLYIGSKPGSGVGNGMPQCAVGSPQWLIEFAPPIRLYIWAWAKPCPLDYSAGIHSSLQATGWVEEAVSGFNRSDGRPLRVWAKTFRTGSTTEITHLHGGLVAGVTSQKVKQKMVLKNQCAPGKYIATGEAGALFANQDKMEKFEMFRNDDSTISLKFPNGKFLVALADGSLFASQGRIGPWAKFSVVWYDDGMTSMKTAHNTYILTDPSGKLAATSIAVGACERFRFEVYGKQYNPVKRGIRVMPPPSRVQMLTRDPCLVQLLREMTPHFKKKIAFYLGLPEDNVIVDPPAVKGTVGLLQLDSQVNSEQHIRQMPVLGVRQCNLVELGELVHRVSLVSTAGAGSAPAPAMMSPAPAPWGLPQQPLFAVATPNMTNGTNGTNATNASLSRVSLVMKLHNIDYDLLAASWSLVSAFTLVTKMSIAAAGHVPVDAVKMALYPGSVVIEAKITPPPGTSPDAVLAFFNGTVCNATLTGLTSNSLTMMPLQNATTGPLDCSITELLVEDGPFEVDESNRAWIAAWSIALLPPFAQDGAWRLLKMINEPGTELSKLLPMTLARIPGMKYRSMPEPNAAIRDAQEVRLPPPEDKAVGFRLPNPISEEWQLEQDMARMKREQAENTLMIKNKNAMEIMKVNAALATSKGTEVFLKNAQEQFVNAARVHAQAIRAPNASKGPDIVPYDVLDADDPDSVESPYPWRDQRPEPSFMLNLAQGQPKAALRAKAKAKLI